MYNDLVNNNTNYISFFENNKRQIKLFHEFHLDIESYIAKFNFLKGIKNIKTIAILGPTSYKWMVIDHACIKGGYKSVGIPCRPAR